MVIECAALGATRCLTRELGSRASRLAATRETRAITRVLFLSLSLFSCNYDYRSAHVCVGGALPRVGDRGNRCEGREGRGGSARSRRRKEGRTDGSRGREMDERERERRVGGRRDERGRTEAGPRISPSFSLHLPLPSTRCGAPETQSRGRYNDRLRCWSASMVLAALCARSKRYIV